MKQIYAFLTVRIGLAMIRFVSKFFAMHEQIRFKIPHQNVGERQDLLVWKQILEWRKC